MHPTLARQIRKQLGGQDPAALTKLFLELQTLSQHTQVSPALAEVLAGLEGFIEGVGVTYEQYERDLASRTRSVETASEDLLKANERLRAELAVRERSIETLRKTANKLRLAAGLPPAEDDKTDLDSLTALMDDLVQQREQSLYQLRNLHLNLEQQQFALDQHAIVSVTDAEGVIVYANERFCSSSGYTQEALIGRTHNIVKSFQHDGKFYRSLWQTILSGQVWQGEIVNRAKDGHLYWLRATIVPMLDIQGKPERFVGICTDISVRKRVEQELASQLHFQNQLIGSVPVPLYFKSADGCYQSFNDAFLSFFHIEREEWIGRTVFDLLPKEQAELVTAKDQALYGGEGHESFELRITTRDGHNYDVIYSTAKLTNPDGSTIGLVGSITDITPQKLSEATMARAKEMAEAASRSKSNFLANMSHEIRTPMNGIIGMTELALETELSADQRAYLETVKVSADALLTILDDVLDLSKIEAGKLALETLPFTLDHLVRDSLRTVAVRAKQKGLVLEHELAPDLPQYLLGDAGRLRQVLLNLLSNAIKFTEHGTVRLRVAMASNAAQNVCLRFSVSDSGIGIPLEKQKIIFEAFSQEDASITRRFGGTGLGLSISKWLVEMLGGKLWVESELGRGSTFHFTARLALDEREHESAGMALNLGGRRALVVDDNSVNRRILIEMLGQLGMETDAVEDGATALQQLGLALANQHCPDLIVLDSQMPGMDGFELAKRLRAVPELQEVALLLLSSTGARGDADRCRELGIAGYLTKPITHADLFRAVRALLRPVDKPKMQDLVTRHSLHESMPHLNILLVEDHPMNQQLMMHLLGKWGHRITLANNGVEAVRYALAERFDLILMDMQMPEMDGATATRIIRAEQKQDERHVPIYALSAGALAEDKARGLEAGVDGYLTKPIKQRELVILLESLAPLEAGAAASEPCFDYRSALAQADQDIISIIGQDFLERIPQDLSDLELALKSEDWPTLVRAAHTLKGNVSMLSAAPLEKLALKMESQARHQHVDASLLPQILKEMACLHEALKERLGQ